MWTLYIGHHPIEERKMTMKTQPETSFDTTISKEDLNYKEETITMQCTNCGYEEEMPAWCYVKEADYLKETNDPEPPCWQ